MTTNEIATKTLIPWLTEKTQNQIEFCRGTTAHRASHVPGGPAVFEDTDENHWYIWSTTDTDADGQARTHGWESITSQSKRNLQAHIDSHPSMVGDAPAHNWSGTSLRFKNADGTDGSYVNLKGEKGWKGDSVAVSQHTADTSNPPTNANAIGYIYYDPSKGSAWAVVVVNGEKAWRQVSAKGDKGDRGPTPSSSAWGDILSIGTAAAALANAVKAEVPTPSNGSDGDDGHSPRVHFYRAGGKDKFQFSTGGKEGNYEYNGEGFEVPHGNDGAKGDPGKDAYETWKANTTAPNSWSDYLKAIKGAKGDTGANAYQTWKANTTSPNAWSDYLKAIKGAEGISAFEGWKNEPGNSTKTHTDYMSALRDPNFKSLGSFEYNAVPANPAINNFYYNETVRKTMIYTLNGWENFAVCGEKGTDGLGLTYLGEFDSGTVPDTPNKNDFYYNTDANKTMLWDGGQWGNLVKDGVSPKGLIHLGDKTRAEIDALGNTALLNNAYYVTDEHKTIVWDGVTWQTLVKDGEAPYDIWVAKEENKDKTKDEFLQYLKAGTPAIALNDGEQYLMNMGTPTEISLKFNNDVVVLMVADVTLTSAVNKEHEVSTALTGHATQQQVFSITIPSASADAYKERTIKIKYKDIALDTIEYATICYTGNKKHVVSKTIAHPLVSKNVGNLVFPYSQYDVHIEAINGLLTSLPALSTFERGITETADMFTYAHNKSSMNHIMTLATLPVMESWGYATNDVIKITLTYDPSARGYRLGKEL